MSYMERHFRNKIIITNKWKSTKTSKADINMSGRSQDTRPSHLPVRDFHNTSLSINDTKTCLLRNETISKSASKLIINYVQTEPVGNKIRTNTETRNSHVCRVNLTTPENTVVRIRFVEQTCSYDNYIAVWVEVRRPRMPLKVSLDSRTGCENWTSPLLVDYFSLTNHVTFALVVREWTAPYIVRLHVTAEAAEQPKLQLYQVSSYLGIYLSLCQSLSVCVSVCLALSLCLSSSVCLSVFLSLCNLSPLPKINPI